MDISEFFPFAFFEGKIVPIEQARVQIMTNALQYGNAVFGGIRGYVASDNKHINIFRIADHYSRFLKSLKIFNTTIRYDQRKLIEITIELAKKNQPKIVKLSPLSRPISGQTKMIFSPPLKY